MTETELKSRIRDIPDFPKAGILFKDITPLLADAAALRAAVDAFVSRYRGKVDVVLGIESRGFILGSAVAYGLGFLPLGPEHYDFAVPRDRLDRPAVRRFVELLGDASVRADLARLGFEP